MEARAPLGLGCSARHWTRSVAFIVGWKMQTYACSPAAVGVCVQVPAGAMTFESKRPDVAVCGNASLFSHATESPSRIVRTGRLEAHALHDHRVCRRRGGLRRGVGADAGEHRPQPRGQEDEVECPT